MFQLQYLGEHSLWVAAANGRSSSVARALEKAKSRKRNYPDFHFRLIDQHKNVIWVSDSPSTHYNPHNNPHKENAMMNVEKPLHIPRETLIEKIQSAYDSAKAKAKEAWEEKAAARKPRLDEVQKAIDETPLAFLRMLESYMTVNVADVDKGQQGFAAWVKQFFNGEDADFEYSDERTEKLLSVLSAATDKELEVTPQDDLYRYL